MIVNPLEEADGDRDSESSLVEAAKNGDKAALSELIRKHRPWIFNIAVKMVWDPHDAEDVTQEVLIKVITKLATFEGRSRFSTWLYRIVVNHVLTMRRRVWEGENVSFDRYRKSLEDIPDTDPSTLGLSSVETAVLVEEARIGCTAGMLMCLDREQRLIYVLAAMFNVPDSTGAALLQISRANFRKKLQRARKDLHSFMNGHCGLIKRSNPCRCAQKTRGFIEAGHVDPKKMRFAKEYAQRIHDVAPQRLTEMDTVADTAAIDVYKSHPFTSTDRSDQFVADLLDSPEYKRIFDL